MGREGGGRRLSWQLIWLVLWPSLALPVHTEDFGKYRFKPPSFSPLGGKKAFQFINAFSWWFKAVSSCWLTIVSPWKVSVLNAEQTKGDTERKQTGQSSENNLWFYGLLNSKDIRNELLTLCSRACVRAQYVWEVLLMEFSRLRKTVKDTAPNWEMFHMLCPVTQTNSFGIIAILVSCLRTGLLAWMSQLFAFTNHSPKGKF